MLDAPVHFRAYDLYRRPRKGQKLTPQTWIFCRSRHRPNHVLKPLDCPFLALGLTQGLILRRNRHPALPVYVEYNPIGEKNGN